ncbi:Acetyltransferase (GNAT) family protein [Kaistia soli DSM 19436]|uniref:Acetyltransferase (GNAT) family protein n=1 Tax=Kaistia soli DSM 19436 TaxID=1122133 RepID=A0A1M4W1G5_9HYPH|nr:GNAT family N-acetyltransferase [Kaistia soli]SHE75124.1 Acetyltransferase (GNAT) family protein [Kaistia soli DSM 19436]
MQPLVVLAEEPQEADHEAILAALLAYNDAAGGPSGYQEVAVLVRHPETGATIGGLWGRIIYDWLFVELLVVPAEFRGAGLGTQLMQTAEAKARASGCVGVWLDTFAFQAPDFYRRLGYQQFGVLPDHPKGRSRFFFMKRLGGAA